MADSMKYVKLKRSETCGFGFSILGGAGSELPPIIYDIIEGSPAANSCQVTTKLSSLPLELEVVVFFQFLLGDQHVKK